uniref:Uncharacterized protein n=1 Tax=Branchiostoma floridae TaxID=7739 RepID=C3Z2V9_BRAFL|eukprot:XP_002597348.1 hypothetical protein BRAFLDRAFT_66484 [Branchiostoma floridae]
MMLKFSILVACLLVASLYREVQSDDSSGSSGSSESSSSESSESSSSESSEDDTIPANVTLKIENSLDSSWPSAEYVVAVPVGTSVYEMMEAAKEQFDDFTFEATFFQQYGGHFIDSINSLAGSTADQTYWRFENGYGAAFDRGVDLILVHANDDVIVFSFASYATGHP